MEVEEALALTLGLSALIYVVFLAPLILTEAPVPSIAYVVTLVTVTPGLVLFPVLFALVTATTGVGAIWRAVPQLTGRGRRPPLPDLLVG